MASFSRVQPLPVSGVGSMLSGNTMGSQRTSALTRRIPYRRLSQLTGSSAVTNFPPGYQNQISNRWISAAAEAPGARPRVLFVLGGPGSGKGTQCKKIVENFPFIHLSAGELLRAERDREGSQFGALINQYITEGKIVPVEITVALLKAEMERTGRSGDWFLIDGFPRSHENLRGWTSVIGDWADVVGVLLLECREEEMEKRILKRAETEGRNDDNLSTIKKRFHTYEADTMPVINHYREEQKLFSIQAEGDAEAVYRNVADLVGRITDLEQRTA